MKKEIARYCISGLLAVATDFLSYHSLITVMSNSFLFAKGISYILGTVVAFFLGRVWTFKSEQKAHKDALRFSLLYISTLALNIFINQALLLLFPGRTFFAFCFATITTIIANYLGQKFWVFKK